MIRVHPTPGGGGQMSMFPQTAVGRWEVAVLESPAGLAAAMCRQAIPSDRTAAWMLLLVHLATIARGTMMPHEQLVLAALSASAVLWLLAATCVPSKYAALRPSLIVALRLANLVALPLATDGMRLLDPRPSGGFGSGTAGGLLGTLGAAAAGTRAVVTLVMGVAFLQGSYGSSIGMQLPPVLHLLTQGVTLLLLCRRATPVCRQYVRWRPQNARLVAGTYHLVQQLTSVLCTGTGSVLDAAAAASSDAQKCTALVWSLQASLGFVLPTLIVWKVQLRAARRYVWDQRDAVQRRAAEEDLQCSQYMYVCEPALRVADGFGWAFTTALAALWGYIAALVFLWYDES